MDWTHIHSVLPLSSEMNFTEDAMRFMDGNEADEVPHKEELDEEEESASDSSSDESDSRLNDEEDETYVRFVRSVFCDDYSGCSNTDDDDEEDYIPDPKDGDDIDSDDDGDRDLVRVQNRELRELVDGCWQTIIGEALQVNNPAIKVDEVDNFGSPQKRRMSSNSAQYARSHESVGNEGINVDSSVMSSDNIVGNANNLYDELEEDLDLSLLSPIGSPVKSSSSGASNNQKAKLGIIGPASGTNVISNMVTKLFSENETSEVCIEGGLPVHAVRKIVARQLSMATQLLVQILLQADERSECFTKGYTSLMELSNLREAALKKATLIEMNYKNATAIRNHTLDLQLAKQRDNLSLSALMGSDRSDYNENEGDSGSDIEGEDSNSSAHAVHENGAFGRSTGTKDAVVENINNVARRLTRSAMAKSIAVHTVFNVPILAKVSTLFDMIDVSRRKIKVDLTVASSRATMKAVDLSPTEVRTLTLTAVKDQVYQILPQLRMRPWRCLLPNSHYPLPANLVQSLDATTLMGRCLFTPAEDDLLLRGIMNVGEANWEQVRAQFMPSKEAQLLQFRYSQMTSLSATFDDNNFKRYQTLAIAYRNRDTKWSNSEELDLLRAYQVFGERWPLVKVFFVPHRKTQQIRFKWSALQKVWQKAFQGQSSYKVGFKRELTPAMKDFLEKLNPPPETATAQDAGPALTPLSSVVVPVGTQLVPSAFGGALLGPNGSGSSAGGGARTGQGAAVRSHGMPLLPPPPQIAIVPPYLGPPVGNAQNTPHTQAAGVAQMPGGMQMPSAMPPSMYPFPMPFMMPPFMQQPAKMPTSPAEFMQYHQQQYFQYQQYMYQMFMMQQQQSQFLQGQHAAGGGQGPMVMQPPGHVSLPVPMPHTSVPSAGPSGYVGPPQPVQASQGAWPDDAAHASTQSQHCQDSAAAAAFDIEGPLLLKNIAGEKPPKRRKFNQVDSSPNASRSRETAADGTTAQHATSSAASATASGSTAASLSFDENSRSVSFLHEDSLFSLLYPPVSAGFGAGADSIPFIGSDHSATDSVTASASAGAPQQSSKRAAIQAKTADKNVPAAAAEKSSSGQGAPLAVPPPLKSILSKPEKKKIRPMLISSAAVPSGPAFQAKKPATSAAFIPTRTVGASLVAPAVSQPVAAVAPPVAPAAPPTVAPASASAPASAAAQEVIELDGRSLTGFDGLSYLWRDADSEENSSSLSMGMGMSMHPSMLGDLSVMDTSKFAFSNFAHPGQQSRLSDFVGESKQSGNSASRGGEQKKAAGGKRKVKDTAASGGVSMEGRKGAGLASPAKTSDHSVLNIDDTSNMSLLGDFFNDGEIAGTHSSFSHLSNLASLAGGQVLTTSAAPVPKSSKSSSRSNSAGERGAKQNNKVHKASEKSDQPVLNNADRAEKMNTASARPFANIGSMTTALSRSATPRAGSGYAADKKRFPATTSSIAGSAGIAGLAALSSSVDRRSPLNGAGPSSALASASASTSQSSENPAAKRAKFGLFAEVMAKSQGSQK